MSEPSASGLPKITSYEDFDVFSGGKQGLPRDEYKKGSFHTSDMEAGDARFLNKAKELDVDGAELLLVNDKLEFEDEKKAESDTIAQTKQAAV